MKFKIFGWTVLIQKDPLILSNKDEEIISMRGDTPIVTQCGNVIGNSAWRYVVRVHFNNHLKSNSIRSKIPLIKMFRDEYRDLRGIAPGLLTSKEYVDARVTLIDYGSSHSYYILNSKGQA